MFSYESMLKDFKKAAKKEAKQRRKAELALNMKPFQGGSLATGNKKVSIDSDHPLARLVNKIISENHDFSLPQWQPVIVNNKLSELIHFYSRGLNPVGKRVDLPIVLFESAYILKPKMDDSGACKLRKYRARYKWSWKLNKAVRL